MREIGLRTSSWEGVGFESRFSRSCPGLSLVVGPRGSLQGPSGEESEVGWGIRSAGEGPESESNRSSVPTFMVVITVVGIILEVLV